MEDCVVTRKAIIQELCKFLGNYAGLEQSFHIKAASFFQKIIRLLNLKRNTGPSFWCIGYLEPLSILFPICFSSAAIEAELPVDHKES